MDALSLDALFHLHATTVVEVEELERSLGGFLPPAQAIAAEHRASEAIDKVDSIQNRIAGSFTTNLSHVAGKLLLALDEARQEGELLTPWKMVESALRDLTHIVGGGVPAQESQTA